MILLHCIFQLLVYYDFSFSLELIQCCSLFPDSQPHGICFCIGLPPHLTLLFSLPSGHIGFLLLFFRYNRYTLGIWDCSSPCLELSFLRLSYGYLTLQFRCQLQYLCTEEVIQTILLKLSSFLMTTVFYCFAFFVALISIQNYIFIYLFTPFFI